jgi:acetyltransferase-like isoleucine patch superfamily enzyme
MLSAIRENLNIGDHSIIGMGSMVFRDIPEKVIAIGNPARVMRKNENNKVFK